MKRGHSEALPRMSCISCYKFPYLASRQLWLKTKNGMLNGPVSLSRFIQPRFEHLPRIGFKAYDTVHGIDIQVSSFKESFKMDRQVTIWVTGNWTWTPRLYVLHRDAPIQKDRNGWWIRIIYSVMGSLHAIYKYGLITWCYFFALGHLCVKYRNGGLIRIIYSVMNSLHGIY